MRLHEYCRCVGGEGGENTLAVATSASVFVRFISLFFRLFLAEAFIIAIAHRSTYKRDEDKHKAYSSMCSALRPCLRYF